MSAPGPERYAQAQLDRQHHVDAVLQSKSAKKIVVAGPGTGKTFLFKEILQGKKRALTLTFVNSLVEDLSLELCGLSEVKTLHGFARSVVEQAMGSAKVFPKLSLVIKEDVMILKGVNVDFDACFHDRNDESEHIAFYKGRKTYYGHYGFSDVIFDAVKYLEQHNDKIPKFDHVVVDEFQDFNLLEVSFIDLLASQSPILIAGDDDQSLYHFKNASPTHLRKRHGKADPAYEVFNLPYCSRCTRVIVDAANDIIKAAKAQGFLQERIDKPYIFFEDEKKEADCKRYPKLTHIQCFATQIPFYIAKAIGEIAQERREKFSVLIIAPTRARCRSVARSLRSKGFENIPFVDQEVAKNATLLDSLSLLAEDSKCNLGWRIASKIILPAAEFKSILEETVTGGSKGIHDLVKDEVRRRVKAALATFKKVSKEQTISDEDSARLFLELGIKPYHLAQRYLREAVSTLGRRTGDPATRNIPIKITTIPSSKGLAEDYVFIVDFDDRFFLEKNQQCSDQKVYDFLVALTRARKKVFLISCEAKEPTFMKWIAKERIEK